MSLSRLRNKIEATIVRAIVTDALKLGYSVSVYDGEEFGIENSTDRKAILAECAATDEDRLYFTPVGQTKATGVVWIIYGEGDTCLTDWTDTPEMNEILRRANKLAGHDYD
jgi:hypothetical protein